MSHFTEIAKAAWHDFTNLEKQVAILAVARPTWDKLSPAAQEQIEVVVKYIYATEKQNYQISQVIRYLKNLGDCLPNPGKAQANMLTLCIWDRKFKPTMKLVQPSKPPIKSYLCSAPISDKTIAALNLQEMLTALTQTAKIYKHLQTATQPRLVELFHERLAVLAEEVHEVDVWISQSNKLKAGSEQEKNIFNAKLDVLYQHSLYLKNEMAQCHTDIKSLSLNATTQAEIASLRTQLKPFLNHYTWINTELQCLVERESLLRLRQRAAHPHLQLVSEHYEQLCRSMQALMLSLFKVADAAKLNKAYHNLTNKAKIALRQFNILTASSTYNQIHALLLQPDYKPFNRVIATQEKLNHFEFQWGCAIKPSDAVTVAYSKMIKKINKSRRFFTSDLSTQCSDDVSVQSTAKAPESITEIRRRTP